MLLIDIILAFSLATVLITIITGSSVNARETFNVARERNRLIDMYESHLSNIETLVPYQSINIDDGVSNISATSRFYGNDRIINNIVLTSSNLATSSRYFRPITFNAVRAYPFTNADEFMGTPLCSPDFSNDQVLGSYRFISDYNASLVDYTASSSLAITVSSTPIALPINPTLLPTDLEVRNGIAYISTDSAIALDPDLIVIDIHDIYNPVVLSYINTGPGIGAITIAKNRIYAAATSITGQLQVIRLDGLGNLILEKKYQLPLPYATATPPLASSIFYNKGKIFLGTEKWSGDEFNIIDVTNPTTPVKISGFEIGSKVNDIFVRDDLAYIATAGQKQLMLVDVHNLGQLVLSNSFSPSGRERQEGKVIAMFEDNTNFGRTSGGYNITTDHEAFSWATTSSTTLVSPSSVDISSGVYGIVADRSRIFLATRKASQELQIFGRSLLSNAYSFSNLPLSHSLPTTPQSMTCDGDSLFILDHNTPIIYKINIKRQ